MFPEERIFRIDHYLGKESVEDLLVFRFSNTLLEPVWNRNYVRSVQITMSETIGVEGRGSFYDSVGAIRDVMQNHLLQVARAGGDGAAGRTRVELPAGREGQGVRGDAADRSGATLVRGQYVGYRDEPGVAPDSQVETFAAARLEIDSWRWAGVPWYVRCGKALGQGGHRGRRRVPRAAEPAVRRGRRARRRTATWSGSGSGKNDGVTFTLQAKTPGPHLDSQNVDLAVDFAAALGERREAYERLLDDAIAGSPRRFAREDIVEQTWRVVQPALDSPGPVHPYFRGSWGPAEADRILARRPLVRPVLSGRDWAPLRPPRPETVSPRPDHLRSGDDPDAGPETGRVDVRRGMTTTVPSVSWWTATLTP